MSRIRYSADPLPRGRGTPRKPQRPDKKGRIRCTVIIPETIAQNVRAFALVSGKTETEVVTEALSEYLRSKGLQPDKPPVISVAYD